MRKDFFYISVLLIFTVFIHWVWFYFPSILTASDWNYIPDNVVSESFSAWNTWIPLSNFGAANIQIPFLFFMSLWAVIVKLGLTYDIATKITFFIPIAILSFVSPYYLSKHLFQNRLVSFTLSLFYGTTAYGIANQVPIHFVYAIAPLLLLTLAKAIEKPSYANWTIFAALYSLGIYYEVRIMYILSFIFLIYILLIHPTNIWKKKVLIPAIYSFILIVSLNLFWLLPLGFGAGGSSIQAVANRGLFGNNLADIFHSIALSPWYWTGDIPNGEFQIQAIQWYLWLIPFFSFSAITFKKQSIKERQLLIFFSIISLIGIFLTKQSFIPFPQAYNWLYLHFPGFNLFRESSKFYLITALGYFGLIGFLLLEVITYSTRLRNLFLTFIIGSIAAVSVINSLPLINGHLGGLFVNRAEPVEYIKLNAFIAKQAEDIFFRTYWVPRDSHWGYYDINTPKISGIDVTNNYWNQFVKTDPGQLIQENIVDIFNHEYSEEFLNLIAVKYIIIPLRDTANDNDFFVYYDGGIKDIDIRNWYVQALDSIPYLKKIDAGTSKVAVYENTTYGNYISTFSNLIKFDNKTSFDDKYDFRNKLFDKSTYFTTDINKSWSIPEIKISDLFDSIGKENIQSNSNILSSNLIVGQNYVNKLYVTDKSGTIYSKIDNNNIDLYRYSGTLALNSRIEQKNTDELIGSIKTSSSIGNYLVVNGSLIPLNSQGVTIIGSIASSTTISAYKSDENIINNGSFEDGLWQTNVGDCNAYDKNPLLKMLLSNESVDGKYSLELQATKHIACVGTSANATDGNYVLSFFAQSPNNSQAKYYLSYANNLTSTSTSRYIPLNGDKWTESQTLIHLPSGTNKIGVTLYGFSSDGVSQITTRYDMVSFKRLNKIGEINVSHTASFSSPISVTSSTSLNFAYENKYYEYDNLLTKGSFEDGLWQQSVGDCANYDDNPLVKMSLENNINGTNSLKLEAKRHFACTSTNVPVQGGHNYLFSFDYQSPNSSEASYYLGFNDASNTSVANNVAITDTNWHTFSQLISVPPGASGVSVVFYAKEKDRLSYIINRYDNATLIEIPNLLNSYYLVSNPPTQDQQPESLTFNIVNPTKKLVHVNGATTGFFLAMSESWHPSWQLEMNNSKIHGPLSSWTPLAHPDKVPGDQHFALDDFLNGWYVDVHQLCEVDHAEGCTKNADGSYDLEMQIEFWPQRWFYVGLVISGTTLVAVLGYLGYSLVQGRKHRKALRKERVENI